MYRMAKLAFETDSTRSITLLLDGTNSPTITVKGAEIRDGLSQSLPPRKQREQARPTRCHRPRPLATLRDLIVDLKSTPEAGSNLLRRTSIVFGSNLGDANKHTTDNMPVLLAGGRFHHGRHLAFDRDDNEPLANLFVSILQQMGIEADRFASGAGPLRGLAPA